VSQGAYQDEITAKANMDTGTPLPGGGAGAFYFG